ncbi:MAG: amidohydrolase family protein [Actinomycetota bacterium]|uniref:Amidohydrolase family protein n=1 Tax=Mycobacterium lentiflavum TaxID=141349 RepID=A0ABY3V3K0_MYCLN|nr:amidohydrolase family protein [Mycobacterium lentiflavum]MEE3065603.1 amidohydrolase family protein [Actinomycetota bacterium]ULP45212.1 amidohydrolase family protein [Mycobacterium lentiflavum]
MSYDTIIRNGRWFDGTGAPSAIRNIGISGGHVTAVSTDNLDEAGCPNVIDASGKWVVPGFLDIHTHYDIEVLEGPGLAESVRHGVTTVATGSCSISTIHVDAEEAGDLFGRVEAIPREYVIKSIGAHKTWRNGEEYIAAIEGLPLGPNLCSFIGHSDIRTVTMGLDRSTNDDVKPTRAEVARMERMLTEALDAGFIGLSTNQLRFDKLDGQTCRSRTLPSTYAKWQENRRLQTLVRTRGRVLQSAPDIGMPLRMVVQAVQSIGLFRTPLKTSLLAAADAKSNPVAFYFLKGLATAVNGLGADFRFQHLPVPFTVYADGIDFVIFEEFGSGQEAMHLADCLERDELMRDEAYRRRFRKDYDQKFGIRVWHRDFFDAMITDCPDRSVVGKSFGEVGIDRGGLHPVDAFLDLVLEHGTKLRWFTTISNHRPEVLKKFATEPYTQLGFSDAGAHLRNMAFYNMGLRLLKHVQDAAKAGRPFMTVEHAVHRLSGEIADWYGIDAGHLRIGDRADLSIIDPERLDDSLEEYAEERVEQYGGLSRMVNRNDATVVAVFVGGRQVVANGVPTDILGKVRTGSFLRAGRRSPAVAPASTARSGAADENANGFARR